MGRGVWAMRSRSNSREATVKRFAALGAILVVLAACGTVYLPGDEAKICAELRNEIAGNEARISELTPAVNASDEPLRISGRIVGLSFAIAKPGDVERIQARSLQRRNSYLSQYASNKHC